ncbi:hypothetical protein [Hymenobacter persicinus]|uniref:SGNH/GDSL hydrolase family protein n=1 Tax=Hymenobacter persicinus TaxID=2025506 RepID=A0A4Q5LAW6_9BACT|nr:hypothetical protein [Hymenobacter persicinus]RYU78143.1 hypothetical protein EWM57_14975 [Hymenobacter persicinus]
MKLTILGGCFPVQHNITPDRLYHQTLKRRLEQPDGAAAVTVDVIRYERFGSCLPRVRASAAQAPIAVLLFHVRAEPVLRLLKLYYKHLDDAGQLRHALNLPRWGRVPAERFDLLTVRPARPTPRPPAPPSYAPGPRRLRELNYRLGTLLGNEQYALEQYLHLVLELADFCRTQGTRLLVTGPVSRPCSAYEDALSNRLAGFFEPQLAAHGIAYLDLLGHTDAAGNSLFLAEGIYVGPTGHDRVASRLHAALTAAATPPSSAPQ